MPFLTIYAMVVLVIALEGIHISLNSRETTMPRTAQALILDVMEQVHPSSSVLLLIMEQV